MVASFVNAVLRPFAAGAPAAPVEPPTMWTLLAVVRREFERTVQSPTVNQLAGQTTNGLVTDTATLNSQSIDPVITGNIGAPTPGLSGPDFTRNFTRTAHRHRGAGHLYRSTVDRVPDRHRVFSGRVCGRRRLGCGSHDPADTGDIERPSAVARHARTERPTQRAPGHAGVDPAVRLGPVVGKYVVAVHGGALVVHPNICNWLELRRHGPRRRRPPVVVPIYPLAPQGTAGTVVPAMADLISSRDRSARSRECQRVWRLRRRQYRAGRRAGVSASR